jgi:hypothetical protein
MNSEVRRVETFRVTSSEANIKVRKKRLLAVGFLFIAEKQFITLNVNSY